MSNFFKRVELESVCKDITVGFVGSMQKEYVEEGVLLLRSLNIKPYNLDLSDIKFVSKEFHQKISKSSLNKNDVVVVRTGLPGTSCVIDGSFKDLNCSDLVIVRPDIDKIDPFYLSFYFNSTAKKFVKNNAVGAIQQHFNVGSAKKMKIDLPPIQTQRKIASILNNLNQKIELNNRINAELEAMAKLVYEYWFVQFDFPVVTLSGVEGSEVEKPYKSSGGKMVWNEELRREIPEGWEVKFLHEIANIKMGQSPQGSTYNEEGKGLNFFQGSTDFGWRFPENRVYTTAPTRFASKGDILLSVRAPIGTMNVALVDCCIGRGLAALNSKDGFSSFLIYQMTYFKQKFDYLNSVGTTFGSLTKDDLYNLKLVYPPKEILKKFEDKVTWFDKKIENNTLENQQLSSLRDWLLPMLMNGQVRID